MAAARSRSIRRFVVFVFVVVVVVVAMASSAFVPTPRAEIVVRGSHYEPSSRAAPVVPTSPRASSSSSPPPRPPPVPAPPTAPPVPAPPTPPPPPQKEGFARCAMPPCSRDANCTLTICCRDVLQEILNATEAYLREMRVPHYAVFGTLLGGIRSNAIIEYTSDVDIAVEHDALETIENVSSWNPRFHAWRCVRPGRVAMDARRPPRARFVSFHFVSLPPPAPRCFRSRRVHPDASHRLLLTRPRAPSRVEPTTPPARAQRNRRGREVMHRRRDVPRREDLGERGPRSHGVVHGPGVHGPVRG